MLSMKSFLSIVEIVLSDYSWSLRMTAPPRPSALSPAETSLLPTPLTTTPHTASFTPRSAARMMKPAVNPGMLKNGLCPAPHLSTVHNLPALAVMRS